MDDISSTFQNTAWPWAFVSLLTICGTFEVVVILITLVMFPHTPKLLEFYLVTIVIVLLLSLYLAVMRSLGAPRQITIHTWGFAGTISYPRWTGRGVRSFSIPFTSMRGVTRWLPGWTVSTDIPARDVRGRLYVTVSNANAVRIRQAWERWKSNPEMKEARQGPAPSRS